MTDSYVFDTEAIVAYLYGEPGHRTVAAILSDVFAGDADGVLAEANASEVFYLIARFEGTDTESPTPDSFRTARPRPPRDRTARTDRCVCRLATHGEADDGHILLADAAAVALAYERDATLLVGGDDEFDDLPLEVSCERFRDRGV